MQEKIELESNEIARAVTGEQGVNLKAIEEGLDVECHLFGNEINLSGDEIAVSLAKKLIVQLEGLVKEGMQPYEPDIRQAIRILKEDPDRNLRRVFLDSLSIKSGRRTIYPKNLSQKLYIDAIRNNDIVFGIGPAGTGKTYLAMAMAISAILSGEVQRIILTRPAVEAGERLGFLPGDLAEKVNPYLRPLYDALYDMLPFDKITRLTEHGAIEVAPLAFMRGRTLNEAFIILDEAQNTTSEQMKMFLTRLGYSSKAVITGDITQIDLPQKGQSGLVQAIKILDGIEGIKIIHFSKFDVVRHRLVMEIIRAYEALEKNKGVKTETGEEGREKEE